MCTFLAINTSSIQLIPATTAAIVVAAGGRNATQIIGTAFAATLGSTIIAILVVKTLQNLPIFALPPVTEADREAKAAETVAEPAEEESEVKPEPTSGRGLVILFAAFLFFTAIFGLMAFLPDTFSSMVNGIRDFLKIGKGAFTFAPDWAEKNLLTRSVETISILAIPFIFTMFPLYAAVRRVPVYEEFVEGAKEGFQVAVRIIPFLVAILAAVGMFRAVGGVDMLARALDPVLRPLQFPPELLPLVFMRPLSGSGSTALFADLVKTHGPDSLIAMMGGTIMGSTETTFYVLAVYFGSVAIRRTRHAVAAGLTADLAGVIFAVIICNLVFR